MPLNHQILVKSKYLAIQIQILFYRNFGQVFINPNCKTDPDYISLYFVFALSVTCPRDTVSHITPGVTAWPDIKYWLTLPSEG